MYKKNEMLVSNQTEIKKAKLKKKVYFNQV